MVDKICYDNYLRKSELPSIWCAGCSNGIIMSATMRAVARMGWEKDSITAISGIGCSSRTPAYLDFNSVQTTHGRPIAFATGIKMHKPDMNIIVFTGDGDCLAIGGNHFLHAAVRNIDMTVIVMNNYIYGMTGGQASPTTPLSSLTTTTPFGSMASQLDLCNVAKAAGATYVARTTAYHINQLSKHIEDGMRNKGFSVIECIAPCITGFGRRNGFRNPVGMYESLRDNRVTVKQAMDMSARELEGKIVTGVFVNETKPEFVSKYREMVHRISPKEDGYFQSIPISTIEEKLDRYEIRLSGSGGQGVILAGVLIAEAGIMLGKNAVHSQSYGPEARGGASKAEVILSDKEINFPELICPDLLLAMSQQSYDKYAQNVKPGAMVLIDSTFVDAPDRKDIQLYKFPITESALKDFENVQVSNVIALGILSRLTNFLKVDALERSIVKRIGGRFKDLNVRALKKGYEYAGTIVR